MPDQFPEYHQARDTEVAEQNTAESFTPDSAQLDLENEAFLRGTYGEGTENMNIPAEPVILSELCENLTVAGGVWWNGQNPKPPRPSKPLP